MWQDKPFLQPTLNCILVFRNASIFLSPTADLLLQVFGRAVH